MNEPMDILFNEGWEVVETDTYAETGDDYYKIRHPEQPNRLFLVVCHEVTE